MQGVIALSSGRVRVVRSGEGNVGRTRNSLDAERLTITVIIIVVIIRVSSRYETCMPLPSDTFHHNIWGRR